VYRDLKPENVMVDEDGHCKLVDFGFVTTPDENGMMRTMCGTSAYLSPEQLDRKFFGGYTKICDWWSFGVFIYELRTGTFSVTVTLSKRLHLYPCYRSDPIL
jgi:serine/threonine protein kinase